MVIQVELERKFLIKFPQSWSQLSQLFDNLVDIKRISQTYLAEDQDGRCPRIRKTIEGLAGNNNIVYHYNKKYPLSGGGNKEEEKEISEAKYKQLLEKSNSNMVEINKTRFVFKYHDQIFELDIFKDPLKGLAILEIELDSKDTPVYLPPFLDVIKEVTGDKTYNNFSLADKKLHVKLQ